MNPPASPPGSLDPNLGLYPYYAYPNLHGPSGGGRSPGHVQQPTRHGLAPLISSPDSHGSGTAAGTPSDVPSFVGANGKRPSSGSLKGLGESSRKKPRKEEEDADDAHDRSEDGAKPKSTRGSRACTVCRRLKMKCVGAEQGPPCKRCISGNHECVFEESNRGKRSTNPRKQELLARSLKKMERTLDTVLRSIGNPALASDAAGSRSPSPDASGPDASPPSVSAALHSHHGHSHSHSLHAARAGQLASPSPTTASGSHSHSQSMSQAADARRFSPASPQSPKLHSLPDNSLNPLGLLAEASLANRRAQAATKSPGSGVDGGAQVGVASDIYFKPGPMTILPLRRLFIEKQNQPEMLSFVSTEEVVALFKIFFDRMNMHCHLLDRDFHTPSLVCSRSPYLLTTICAGAAKFYTPRPELHPKLVDIARRLAFEVPAKGYKSVEIVQAYLLCSLWGCGPVERFEQDKTWMLLGMAIRMATDLNLHRRTAATSPDAADGQSVEREIRNRERTWVLCYCLDRSVSAQMGKPHSIREDSVLRAASEWIHTGDTADRSLAAYMDLQRMMSRSLDVLNIGNEMYSFQPVMDYYLVIRTMEDQISEWYRTWTLSEPAEKTEYLSVIGRFYYNYALLVLNSFGLQHALEHASVDTSHFFTRCLTTATACATVVRDDLGPLGYLKYSPDSHFVLCSYAVLSLLKLIRPEFKAYMAHEARTLALVTDVADALESIAAGPLHTPALYAAFLRALVTTRQQRPADAADAADDRAGAGAGAGTGSGSGPGNGNGNGADDMQNSTSSPNGHAFVNGFANPMSLQNMNMGFQFNSEMGPVADMSTFPPTMATNPTSDDMLSMDSILASGFWDNVLVPGYSNPMEGLSGGFVYGVGGTGLITPRLGMSPIPSGATTPARLAQSPGERHHGYGSSYAHSPDTMAVLKAVEGR